MKNVPVCLVVRSDCKKVNKAYFILASGVNLIINIFVEHVRLAGCTGILGSKHVKAL